MFVLLHAFPVNSSLYDDVRASLSDVCELITPDLAGFGETACSEAEPSLDVYADDVIALLDDQGIEQAVVGGTSMGGYVAMALARRNPERITALVLADTKATADTPDARANRLAVAELVLAAGSTVVLARAMLPNLLGATTHESRPDVVERVRAWIESADPRAVAWAQRAMSARPDSLDHLASFEGPSLVVWGDEDAISSRAEQEFMRSALVDGEFVTLPGAGHLSAVEDSTAFEAAVMAFLTRLGN